MKDNIQNEYSITFKIASFDTDMADNLRLSAILRYQQEAAERQLEPLGAGWCQLAEQGMAFVASRWHAVIHRLPTMEETVTLTTWHRERKGPRFLRCYRWQDETGAVLIEGVMQFALLSAADHRLLRGEEFDAFGLPNRPDCGVACTDPAKFSLPALTPAFDFTVRRSDTDRNRHLNNTRYADLLWDALPEVSARPVDVQLHFAGEAPIGSTMTLSAGTDGEAGYVRGEAGGKTIFAGRVAFAPEVTL